MGCVNCSRENVKHGYVEITEAGTCIECGRQVWKAPDPRWWRFRALRYDIAWWFINRWRGTRWHTRRYEEARREALFECRGDFDRTEITKMAVHEAFYGTEEPGEWCPRCGAPMNWGDGMAGEPVAFCSRDGCHYGYCDNAQAIRNVI
jgi:hypothetical protein